MIGRRLVSPLWGVARSLVFGCFAALGVVVWQLLLMGLVGAEQSFQVFVALGACAFPVFVAPSLRAAFVSLALTVPLGAVIVLFAHDATSAVVGGALTVAVARAVMLRASSARSLVLEVLLLLVSLTAARLFGGGRPLELGVGVWTYCLVQSSYFLFIRPSERAPEVSGDAFEVAHGRASALLERRP